MKKNISKSRGLAFPLLFGGIISLAGLAFVYRENWLGDIESERNKLYKENAEGRKMIEDFKKQHGNL